MRATVTNSSSSCTSFGTSSRSGLLRSGSSTRLMPARCAASTFSLRPPIGSTRPRSEISPVIATSWRTRMPVSSDTSAVNIVTPALGPSLGMPPAGMWMWMSLFSRKSFAMPYFSALVRT